jgi:hypothetical protein
MAVLIWLMTLVSEALAPRFTPAASPVAVKSPASLPPRRVHDLNAAGRPLPQKQNITKMLLSEQYWGCLTVLGNMTACSRARLGNPCEINTAVTEPRPSGSGHGRKSPKPLSTPVLGLGPGREKPSRPGGPPYFRRHAAAPARACAFRCVPPADARLGRFPRVTGN